MLETAVDESESAIEFLKSKPKKYRLMGITVPAPAEPPIFAYITSKKTAKYPKTSTGKIGKTPLCWQSESVREQNSKLS